MITSLVRSKGITALNLNLSDQKAPRPTHGASRAEMTGLEDPVLEQIRHRLGSALSSKPGSNPVMSHQESTRGTTGGRDLFDSSNLSN